MIGRRPDFDRFAAWERDRAAADVPDLARNLRVVEALHAEAVALGRWPPAGDPLAGLDVKRRVARAFNVRVAPR